MTVIYCPFGNIFNSRKAFNTFIGAIFLIAALVPEPEFRANGKAEIAGAPAFVVTYNFLSAEELDGGLEASDVVESEPQLPEPAPDWAVRAVIRLIDWRAWERAAAQFRRFKAEGYNTNSIASEAEPRILAFVTPIPATRYQENLEGYELLALLRPDNQNYQSKVSHYRSKLEEEREHAVTKLTRSEDRIEGITWYKHPNQPNYLNIRSTVYLYIGKKGEAIRPWLRMQVQYTSSDWLFVERVFAWHDGTKELLIDGPFERDSNTTIWEWIDVAPSDSQIKTLRALADSEESILRFEGAQYRRDVTLRANDKQALREVLLAYEVMSAGSAH